MSPPGGVPGIPGARLPRQQSDEGEVLRRAAEALKLVDELELRVDKRVTVLAAELNGRMAGIEESIAKFKAAAASMTVKIIMAVVAAAGSAVAGAKVTEQAPPPATVVQRSAFDRGLDACRQLPAPDAQGECIGRVVRDSMGGGR